MKRFRRAVRILCFILAYWQANHASDVIEGLSGSDRGSTPPPVDRKGKSKHKEKSPSSVPVLPVIDIPIRIPVNGLMQSVRKITTETRWKKTKKAMKSVLNVDKLPQLGYTTSWAPKTRAPKPLSLQDEENWADLVKGVKEFVSSKILTAGGKKKRSSPPILSFYIEIHRLGADKPAEAKEATSKSSKVFDNLARYGVQMLMLHAFRNPRSLIKR